MIFAQAALAAFLGWNVGEVGVASVYVDRRVACPGERYDAGAMAAAHRTLPCGSDVVVFNPRRGGRTVRLRIVDRGPHVPGRIVDLTPGAARALGIDGLGIVWMAPVSRQGAPGSTPGTFDALWRLRRYPER